MSREVHVQFCERAGVKLPCATHLIITGVSKEILENEVRPLVEEFLRERGLALSPDKTRITHIKEGFDFLGQNLRKYDGKMLIKPSKKNVGAFLEKIRGIIKTNKTASQVNLIGMLNPIIRGWANYHRHIVASKTFGHADFEIWKGLWRWARRRHPGKSARWVRKRYFHPLGTRAGTFAAVTDRRTSDGQPIWLKLAGASESRIRRHVKIQSEANPYDPRWGQYFLDRAFRKKFGITRQEAGITPS